MLLRALSLLLLLLSSSLALADADADTAALLARAKTASGGAAWDTVTALSAQGQMKAAGLSGTVEVREDLRRGRSVVRYELGLFKGGNGYDGSVSWNQDPGGEVARLDAPEAQRQARTAAWLSARAYWYPQRGAASYAAAGTREEEGRRYRVLTATPAGGEPVELWFGTDSGLLERTVTSLAAPERLVTRLQDWRDSGGLRLPFHIVTDRGSDKASRIELLYARMDTQATVSDADFAVPQITGGAHITAASGVTRIPFRIVRDHIHVQVQVDGHPLQMLVDTGGMNILLPAAVKKIGLKTEGELVGRGVGEQTTQVALARATSLRLGEVEFDKPLFYILDFGQLPDVEGEDFDGVIGYELFQRFGVTIDYANRQLLLANMEKFTPPAGATAVPFTLIERIPLIEGRIDGRPARISVDTGSGAAIDLHSPFVRQHGLKQRYGASYEQISGWGVGGPMRAWPVRLGKLEIGGFELPQVAASLYTGDKGAFASPDNDANLGGRVLGRFTVAFDYVNKKMYLAPNARFGAPFPHDRSGLMLLRDGDALKAFDVLAKGPAAAAGLKPGDRILQLDGKPVAARSLSDWRDWLAVTPAGTRVEVGYQREGKPGTATLVLKDLVPVEAKAQ
jgi:predicted aspartyl protease